MTDKKFTKLVFFGWIVMIGIIIVANSKSRDLDELIDRPKNHIATTYYPEHRVFCATRQNAVSCVFVDR